MPRAGRPPKPEAAKRRAGNPGKRALPDAPTGTGLDRTGAPAAPTGLKAPGKRAWTDIYTLASVWVLPLDAIIVESACRTFDEMAEHRADIARLGRLIEEPVLYHGEVVVGVCRIKANPAVASLRKAEAQWERWLSILAIPPTERARLGLAQVKAQSKLEQLLERRQRGARSQPKAKA